ASACAARSSRAPCVPRTWPRKTRSTARAVVPTRCAVLSGRLPAAEFTGKRLYEVMDLCLECKGCKAECPSNVDMAKLKYEFLYHYSRANGLPLRNRAFGRVARLSALGARTPRLANAINALSPVRWLMEKTLGIDRRRPLPAVATETFEAWFSRHTPPAV